MAKIHSYKNEETSKLNTNFNKEPVNNCHFKFILFPVIAFINDMFEKDAKEKSLMVGI